MKNKENKKNGANFKWEPWDEHKPKEAEVELPIKEPPCRHCCYWKPRRRYEDDGSYIGVVLCHSEEMIGDFSCYRKELPKEPEPEEKKDE